MEIYEIIIGAVILVICIFLVILCVVQGKKDQGMTSAITGSQNDSAFSKNGTRTREAQLARITKVLSVLFFVTIFVLNIINAFAK